MQMSLANLCNRVDTGWLLSGLILQLWTVDCACSQQLPVCLGSGESLTTSCIGEPLPDP